MIWVWTGSRQPTYPEIPWFPELLDDGFSHATFQQPWNTHYTRSIEAQLDVSHLPFVHKKTIGRGLGTKIDGPHVEFEDDVLRIWTRQVEDDGEPARKPAEVPRPEEPPGLVFRFPNVWRLRISDSMYIVNINVPVDDENCINYSRSYQSFLKIPGLRWLFHAVNHRFSAMALHEDRRIAEAQPRVPASLDSGDKYIPADLPIVLYLRRRKELLARCQELQVVESQAS